MTVLTPDGVLQQGATSTLVIQTMAAPSAPSLATDIGAATTANVSCLLYGVAPLPNTTQNKGTRPRRSCSKRERQAFGSQTTEFADLQYAHDPQALSTAPVNKARAACTPGAIVYLVQRHGLDAETAPLVAAQKVDVLRVQLGKQNKTRTGDGEFDEFSITQGVIVLDIWEDVAIAA